MRCKNLLMPAHDPAADEVVETCSCGFRVEALPEDMRTAMLIHQALTHPWVEHGPQEAP